MIPNMKKSVEFGLAVFSVGAAFAGGAVANELLRGPVHERQGERQGITEAVCGDFSPSILLRPGETLDIDNQRIRAERSGKIIVASPEGSEYAISREVRYGFTMLDYLAEFNKPGPSEWYEILPGGKYAVSTGKVTIRNKRSVRETASLIECIKIG